MVVIVGQALRDTTSHFNVSTPFDAAIWNVMAGSIGAVWVATLVISVVLFANPGPDPAWNLAIRAGAVISVIGMALGFLMTIPSAAQIQADNGIVGAHTVGLEDGGPGLRCSAETGRRASHPALRGNACAATVPLLLIMLEVLSRRFGCWRTAQSGPG